MDLADWDDLRGACGDAGFVLERRMGYIVNSIYPITLSVGTVLLNLAFMAGIFRQASDLKQNLTMEIFLGLAVKLLFANVLMQGASASCGDSSSRRLSRQRSGQRRPSRRCRTALTQG